MTETEIFQVRDYVLLMLGAPVVKIELDEEHLELCVTKAIEDTNKAIHRTNSTLTKMGALALAKIMLGRIRGKYKKVPGPGSDMVLDGAQLTHEGNADLVEWKEALQECANVVSRFGL
jgi:hypothetical protein